MSGIRFGLILIIAAGLVIFTVQNLSPSLSLVFLAGRTQAFPLAFWLLAAIALGALTTLLIAGLTGFGPSARRKTQRPRFTEPRGGPSASRTYGFSAADGDRTVIQDTPQATSRTTTQNPPQASAEGSNPRRGPTSWMPNFGWGSGSGNREKSDWTDTPSPEEWEDWSGYDELNRPDVAHRVMNEDLDEFYGLEDEFQPSPQPEARSRPTSDWTAPASPRSESVPPVPEPPPRDYEVKQEPKQVYRSGSVYSYSYRNAEETGVGRSDDVFARSASDANPEDERPAAGFNESSEFSEVAPLNEPPLDSRTFETESAYDEPEGFDQDAAVQDYRRPTDWEDMTQDSRRFESEPSDDFESFEADSDLEYGPDQAAYPSRYADEYDSRYADEYEEEIEDYADEPDIAPDLEPDPPLEPIDPSLSVYDAEYRVIEPPYRSLDDEEDLEDPLDEDLADGYEEDSVDNSADPDSADDWAYPPDAKESAYRSEPEPSPEAVAEDWDDLDDWPEEAYTTEPISAEPISEATPAPASAPPDAASPERDLDSNSAIDSERALENDTESWDDWDDWNGFVEQDTPNDRWGDEV